MHVAHQEDAGLEAGDQLLDGGQVQVGGGSGFLQPGDDAVGIAFRLQAADEPRADVGEALVIQVDRVLGGHQHAQPEGARLLEERHQRLLAGRVLNGREVPEDLVNVEQGAQAGGAALAAHPGHQRFQHQGHDEHALGVVEVRGVEDGDARLALRRVKQALDVHRHAFQPRAEGRRRDDAVERHRQGEALLLREVLIQGEHAQLLEWRLLYLDDDVFQGEVFARPPVVLEDVGEQHMLRVLDRLGGHPGQGEDRGDHARNLLAQGLLVALKAAARRAQRGQDADRQARRRAGGVERNVRRAAEPLHPLRGDAPVRQAVLPLVGFLGGVGGHVAALADRLVLVNPRFEGFRVEAWEVQQQVADVTFGVNDDRRDAIQDGFLEQGDAQAGLAAAGHAQDQTVGGQVARIVIDHLILDDLIRLGLIEAPDVEVGRCINKGHGCTLSGWETGLPRQVYFQACAGGKSGIC